MPQPSPTDVHVDAPLTNISIAYGQDQANFIAGKVFPAVPVDKQSDKYFTYDKDDWFRDEAQKRAPASESAGGGFGVQTDSYLADVWAWHKDVDEQTRANADSPISVDADAARFCMDVLLIRREREWVSTYFGLNIWATDVVAGTDFTAWDDAASDPEQDVQVGVKTILKSTGRKVSDMTVGFATHQALKRHPLIKDRFKYTSSDSITAAMLANFFEVANYHVAEAVYSSTNEDAATSTMVFAAGENCLLSFAPPSPSLLTPSAGYNFIWTGLTGLNNLGIRTKTIPMPLKEADRIECEMAFDMKAVSTDLGYFLSATAT